MSPRKLTTPVLPRLGRNRIESSSRSNTLFNNMFMTLSSRHSPKNKKLDAFEKIKLSNNTIEFPDYESSKYSDKLYSKYIKSFAVNTYRGLSRKKNEDRVVIVLNINKPEGFKGYWPQCSFFGIYDGYRGYKCADFMKEYLHIYIVKDLCFPGNPEMALKNGFAEAEKQFTNIVIDEAFNISDRSGTCATVALIIDDMCYIANCGDSRAILSQGNTKQEILLTRDHTPLNEKERERVIKHGGKVFQ
jgi:protein phosphatase 2C family protein 2/3